MEVLDSFMSPESHPDTIEYAKTLIDGLQVSKFLRKHSRNVPRGPAFHKTSAQRKQAPEEMYTEEHEYKLFCSL